MAQYMMANLEEIKYQVEEKELESMGKLCKSIGTQPVLNCFHDFVYLFINH